MFEERRLHPIALIKEIITNVRRNIVPIVVGLFSVFRAINSNGYLPDWAVYLIIVIVILLILTPAVLKYITYKYTLEDQGIRIKYGLIFRKNTYIPYERIQTVQKKQWFFFIPFNVCQILIETAGGNGKAEADLVAVPVGVVDELKDLRDGKKRHPRSRARNRGNLSRSSRSTRKNGHATNKTAYFNGSNIRRRFRYSPYRSSIHATIPRSHSDRLDGSPSRTIMENGHYRANCINCLDSFSIMGNIHRDDIVQVFPVQIDEISQFTCGRKRVIRTKPYNHFTFAHSRNHHHRITTKADAWLSSGQSYYCRELR